MRRPPSSTWAGWSTGRRSTCSCRPSRRRARSAPMRLWILGDGSERGRLEALAAALGLPATIRSCREPIHFAGWLPQAECAARLHEADALVLPSLLECGGAVVLEAMSLAKPVIATAWGGPLDYLDADCGVLVEPRSREAIVEGFAAAMVELAGSPALRRRLGARWPCAGAARVRLGNQGRPHAGSLFQVLGPPSRGRRCRTRERRPVNRWSQGNDQVTIGARRPTRANAKAKVPSDLDRPSCAF